MKKCSRLVQEKAVLEEENLKARRKAMTNLDNVLKGRDTNLQTNVCIVKAMVFPVVK